MNWKECQRQQLLSNFRYYIGIWVEELRKMKTTSVKIIGVLAEIQTGHLTKTSQKFYSLKKLAWWEIRNYTKDLSANLMGKVL
jgi:hypothetical protein